MKLSHPSVQNWIGLASCITSILEVKQQCINHFSNQTANNKPDSKQNNNSDIPSYCSTMKKITDLNSRDLMIILSSINEIFDAAESQKYGRFIVRPGVSSEVDKSISVSLEHEYIQIISRYLILQLI